MSGNADHWFDRLARDCTRRGALGTIAAVGAALFLPTSRREAHAASTDACQKGCIATSHAVYDYAAGVCSSTHALDTYVGLLLIGPLGAAGAAINIQNVISRAVNCMDRALLSQRSMQLNCLQPGCPGFDPKMRGGPCDTCTQACCADPSSDVGYTCCIKCSSSGGCCASANDNC